MSFVIPTEGKDFAIVARGPSSAGQWKYEPIIARPIKEDEVVVSMVASGICFADVHFGDVPVSETGGNPAIWYPRVLGHEGTGYVDQIGSAVKDVKPGDPVVLSFNSCGECYNCKGSHPAYCVRLFGCNFHGEKQMYASNGSDEFDIGGSFFGQSSFASRAIVKARTVVNLAKLNVSREELIMLAPLGCGVQTGTGAFTNIAKVQPEDEVAVLGVGGVGQSAIMAAAMIGCKTIIAVDRVASRLQMARSLGATHTIDTLVESTDLVSEVLKITGGRGVHCSLDTTGVQQMARQSWDFVRSYGKILQVGLAKPEDRWDVPMADHMNSGKQIIGCVQGDSIPQEYIPTMIEWYRKSKLPLQKLITTYRAEDYKRALEDMRHGETIKPVLVWSAEGICSKLGKN